MYQGSTNSTLDLKIDDNVRYLLRPTLPFMLDNIYVDSYFYPFRNHSFYNTTS